MKLAAYVLLANLQVGMTDGRMTVALGKDCLS
jgi:hypothetical protein